MVLETPIHPRDYHLLGFRWEDKFYLISVYQWGLAVRVRYLKNLVRFTLDYDNRYHASGMSNYIDDFFFIGPLNSQKCLQDVLAFEQLCNTIGIPIKQSKTVLPTTKLTIYGIEVDSISAASGHLRSELAVTSRRKKETLRDLQSLIGLLNFACIVVVPGRAFLR